MAQVFECCAEFLPVLVQYGVSEPVQCSVYLSDVRLEKLLADGITAFTHSLDELLASLKEKRRVLLESQAARKGGIRSTRVA
jgi:hypothetical protein